MGGKFGADGGCHGWILGVGLHGENLICVQETVLAIPAAVDDG